MSDARQPTDAADPAEVRPSAVDQAFLELERPGLPPLHIGWAVELEGPAPSAPLMRAVLAGAIGAAPPLTRRLARDPLTGGLRWVDDAWLDLAAHVDTLHVRSLDARSEIDALITRLFAEQLPRDRPLWRIQAVTDGAATLMSGQLHHVIADGIGSVELALALVGGILSDQVPAAPALPAPSLLEGVSEELAGLARTLSDVGGLSALATGAKAYVERRRSSDQEPWDGPRTVARARIPLQPLREGVRSHGGTVTAALVVAVARALRDTGIIDPQHSEAFVPLNARREGHSSANPVSVIYAPLPATGDPLLGLREVVAALKRSRRQAQELADLSTRLDDLPAAVRGTLTRQLSGQFLAPVIVSSVPGPPEPVEILGRTVTGAWGWAPSPAGQPVALTAVSYAGSLHLTLVGDTAALIDPAETLQRILTELSPFLAA